MEAATTPLLPGQSWTEGNHLVTEKGNRLKRWGSVQQACAVLDDCDRQTIYDLYHAGTIKGYKRNPMRPNSHLRIDLLDVWQLKQSQVWRA